MPNSLQLYSSADMMKMQDRANAEALAQQESSRVTSINLKQALKDSGEAIKGIMYEVHGNASRPGLYDLCCTGNRLRGLGFILAALSACMLIVNYLLAK